MRLFGRPAGRRIPDAVVGLSVSASVTLLLVAVDARLHHTFVVPVFLLGVLTCSETARQVRRNSEWLDPRLIISALSVHMLFLAPLLHVHLDYWMTITAPPEDWRDWLGWMAWLNLAGFIAYLWTVEWWSARSHRAAAPACVWRLNATKTLSAVGLALAAALLTQSWLLYRLGGLHNYLAEFATRYAVDSPFRGTAWAVMLAESAPMVFVVGFVALAGGRPHLRRAVGTGVAVLIAVALVVVFCGLRGSRATVVWNLLWIAGAIHLTVRPVRTRWLVLCAVPFLVFMYVYSLYKALGADVIAAAHYQSITGLAEETGRTMSTVLLGDLARSDVQAYVLYATSHDSEYSYSFGRTYAGAFALVIPESWWEGRPPTKIKEGTDAQYGPGMYDAGRRSSRIYGLAGETLLNFGPLAVPFAFVGLGLAVGSLVRLRRSLAHDDGRLLVVPLLSLACVQLFANDSDNLLWLLVKYGAVLFVVVWAGSERRARDGRRSGVECGGPLATNGAVWART